MQSTLGRRLLVNYVCYICSSDTDWNNLNSWLVMQRYVVDGNFTAQHMIMKQPSLDVALSDGLAYMVENADYQAHLSSAVESKEVCHDVF